MTTIIWGATYERAMDKARELCKKEYKKIEKEILRRDRRTIWEFSDGDIWEIRVYSEPRAYGIRTQRSIVDPMLSAEAKFEIRQCTVPAMTF